VGKQTERERGERSVNFDPWADRCASHL